MNLRARLLPALAAVGVLAALLWAPWEAPTVTVAASDDLQATLDAAPEGAVVVLEAGNHRGDVRVDRPLTIRGLPGARVVAEADAAAAITVVADGTVIEDLAVRGASTGVVVREAQGVIVRDVVVGGSNLHGIEVIDAAAHIAAARIDALRHPMAQGIEVRNSDGRPDTIVERSVISGGQEGIVSHVSEVLVRDNHVSGTTMRGITITEMSDGVVQRNTIAGATGAGLYCGDMSRCEFSENDVRSIASGSGGRSTDGWGAVVTYHAVASTEDDRLSGEAGALFTSIGGHVRDDSPLDPAASTSTWLPVVAATSLAGLSVWLVYRLGRRLAVKLDNPVRGAPRRSALLKPGGVWPLVLGGLAVQTFHMTEHGLQVFRVRVDQIPSRGGIVGPAVEAEWVHFVYNAAVLLAIAFIAVARARGWRPPGGLLVGDRFLVAALVIQGYHALEHAAKLGQHLVSGAKVNPGLAGEVVDLVLFHYAINLAVYVSLIGATLAYAMPVLTQLKERIPQRGRRRTTAGGAVV